MNLLKGRTCYLSGPIEYAQDFGITWREELTQLLFEKYGVEVLDPHKKHTYFKCDEEIDETTLVKDKVPGRFDEYSATVRRIVRFDLRLVDRSDFLILYHIPKISVCGTPWEACVASSQKKPIIILTKSKKEDINGWYFGVLDHNMFFENIQELTAYLDRINSGQLTDIDKRKWIL